MTDAEMHYNRHGRTGFWGPGSPTTKIERMLGSPTLSYKTHMAVTTCHNEKRKSFNSSMLVRLSYKRACPAGHNKYRKWYYTAAPPTGNGPGPEL